MSYILNLDENKNLTLQKNSVSYVNENNADSIICLLPQFFKEHNLKDCFVLLHITIKNLLGQEIGGDTVELKIEDELYKDKYVSYFDIGKKYTAAEQIVVLKIEILSSDFLVAYSNDVSFPVASHKMPSIILPENSIGIFEEYLLEMKTLRDECISIRDEIRGDVV